MKITIEFEDINEHLEFREKLSPSKIKKLIDGDKEQVDLINAMSRLIEYLITKI